VYACEPQGNLMPWWGRHQHRTDWHEPSSPTVCAAAPWGVAV